MMLAALHLQQHIGMTQTTFPAANLLSTQRIDLAVQAISGSANISFLLSEHHVSRKFVCQEKDKTRLALDNAFTLTTPDEAVPMHAWSVTLSSKESVVASDMS